MVSKLITIDGPSGVGKGTASRAVATALGWKWLDSGALYRLTAYAADTQNVDAADPYAVADIARHLDVDFVLTNEDEPPIMLAGLQVNQHIRTEACGVLASKVSAFPEVREALFERQRAFFTDAGLVADGRDMGTVVFPEAPLKIFLTADASVRAKRRHKQLLAAGVDVNMAALLAEIEARDRRDQQRKTAPLRPADDAVCIDTSHLSIDEVCQQILSKAKSLGFLVA